MTGPAAGATASVDGGELDPLRRSIVPVLRGGVALSCALLLVGIALFLLAGGSGLLDVRAPASLALAGNSVAYPSASGVVLLGFLVLSATPLARVALSMAYFARSSDRAFTALTGFVLAVLVATIVIGVTL
jgi:uncharacterized membrane protein